MEELVSVVIPVYNVEKYIGETIKTVLEQSYSNLEVILVEDGSTDNSLEIIEKYLEQLKEERFILLKNSQNSGAAISRNLGVEHAKGRFVCYLDADDLWEKSKIEKQVKFMMDKKVGFSFTSYEFCDEDCKGLGKIAKVPPQINYKEALESTTIFTSTVMFDTKIIDKSEIVMPNIKSEDTALWWKILKKNRIAYGIEERLVYYRKVSNSLSANKFSALQRIWNLYRKHEGLNIFVSFKHFVCWLFKTAKRRW